MVGRRKAPKRDGRTRCQRAPPAPAARSADSGYPDVDALHRAHRRASPCRPAARRRLRRERRRVLRSDRGVLDRRQGRGRLPGPRGARPEDATAGRRPRPSIQGATARRAGSGRSRRSASTRSASPAGRGRSVPSGRSSSPCSARPASMPTTWPRSSRRRAQTAARTKINGESGPTVAGRPGHRIDTTTSASDQSVIVWPATEPDVVNVVISSDLPEARIQDAIDAYGGR